jgi:hypothetical protein
LNGGVAPRILGFWSLFSFSNPFSAAHWLNHKLRVFWLLAEGISLGKAIEENGERCNFAMGLVTDGNVVVCQVENLCWHLGATDYDELVTGRSPYLGYSIV